MVTVPQIEKLLLEKHHFTHLNLSMLLVRMKMNYMKNSSPSLLETCAKEISEFLDRHKSLIASEDVAYIQSL
jgi:hypothetical protein